MPLRFKNVKEVREVPGPINVMTDMAWGRAWPEQGRAELYSAWDPRRPKDVAEHEMAHLDQMLDPPPVFSPQTLAQAYYAGMPLPDPPAPRRDATAELDAELRIGHPPLPAIGGLGINPETSPHWQADPASRAVQQLKALTHGIRN